MAEDDPRESTKPDPNHDIAAADWLFQDDPKGKAPQQSPKPTVGGDPESGEIFALADGPSSVEMEAPAAPIPPVADVPRGQARPPREAKTARVSDQPMLEPSAL